MEPYQATAVLALIIRLDMDSRATTQLIDATSSCDDVEVMVGDHHWHAHSLHLSTNHATENEFLEKKTTS